MAKIRILGEGVERTVELLDPRLQIGRARGNDIVLPDPDMGVSRIHAELRYENGRYVIVDLQSQNGTWVNGRRVERAEVPVGAEIALGEYRLTLQSDSPSIAPERTRQPRTTTTGDLPLRRHTMEDAAATTAVSRGVPKWVIAACAAGTVVLLAGVAWVFTSMRAAGSDAGPNIPIESPVVAQPTTPVQAAPTPGEKSEPDRENQDPDQDAPPLPSGSSTTPARVRNNGGRGQVATGTPRVGRRAGESVEAWQNRSAALQTRYGYSKAALERGDFAAAVGGFEAILLEEPGFLDAPQLLVQAQAGLRGSARTLVQAGGRLEAVGDWVGARQKYEQAQQIYASVPGLPEALKRVREKLRVAGTNSFNQAKEHEANGRFQEALSDYQRALQWLPPDDPNRQIARSRIEQLRRN